MCMATKRCAAVRQFALNPDFIGVIIRAICAIRFICGSDKWHILPRWGYEGKR